MAFLSRLNKSLVYAESGKVDFIKSDQINYVFCLIRKLWRISKDATFYLHSDAAWSNLTPLFLSSTTM